MGKALGVRHENLRMCEVREWIKDLPKGDLEEIVHDVYAALFEDEDGDVDPDKPERDPDPELVLLVVEALGRKGLLAVRKRRRGRAIR